MSAAEPTIICPKCKTEIKLTESLAAPLEDVFAVLWSTVGLQEEASGSALKN